jgi:hypothetical protein
MNTNYMRKIVGLLLVILLLLAIAVLSSTSVAAQGQQVQTPPQPRTRFYGPPIRPRSVRPFRHFHRDPFYHDYAYNDYYGQYVFDNNQKAEEQGYHDGLKTGLGDAKNRRSYDPERSHYFHDAGFGNFAEAYRSGFVRGYQNGYRS